MQKNLGGGFYRGGFEIHPYGDPVERWRAGGHDSVASGVALTGVVGQWKVSSFLGGTSGLFGGGFGAAAEDGCAYPDLGCAFFYGYFEIVGHAHGEDG